ncbi:MAG: Tn3 family transposase, partial [Gammaproteobacteria bacterium]|nr:Tn3 family transposase [Gammaproteobacteria bacterium]
MKRLNKTNTTTKTKRLQILSNEEVSRIYDAPQFNQTEQSHFFSLPKNILDDLKIKKSNGKNTSSKVYFILQYGYFKAKHQFYDINYTVMRSDVAFIMETYFPNDKTPKQLPTRKIISFSKETILQAIGFSNDDEKKDKLILKGTALKTEELRLIQLIKSNITKNTCESLDNLFQHDESFYKITALKFDAKSFQTQEMTGELEKLDLCKSIYEFARKFLSKLSLSRRMIDYYSDLAQLYSVDRLKSIPKELSYLYLICYVNSRCEKINNNLIQGFTYYVDKYHSDSEKYAEKNIPLTNNTLEQEKIPIGKLLQIYINKKIMKLDGGQIEKHAFKVMSEEKIDLISKELLKNEIAIKKQEQKLMWEYHKDHYQALITNLRPLFLAIDFESDGKLKSLFKAIHFLKSLFRKKKPLSQIPFSSILVGHIKPEYLVDYFTEVSSKKGKKIKKTINPYQYEFYIYKAIRDNIRSSKIFINNSTDYKSFESEIKIPPNWDKVSCEVLKNLNNKILLRPIDETLSELQGILEALIERTTKRALNGENKHINIKRHRDGSVDFTIPYPAGNEEEDNPFYDQLEIKTISEIFDFVEQQCHFMRKFVHIKQRGASIKKDYLGIKASILADGTMQGTNLFAKRSNLKYQRLQLAEKNHIRLQTLRDSADVIANRMINLPIFDLYDLGGKKHGYGDGTKKKTRRRILKARHSQKYFGYDIGLVIMTMGVNFLPFVTDIISPNEHESHFIYPMLRRNNTDVDIDIVSTDTAGANNVNDFFHYLIDKIHAPCYRSSAKKTKDTLVGFMPLSEYKDLLITPSETVDLKLIHKEWPNLVPILASMLSHKTNQESIIKMLSSHEYKSDTKKALWELNKILKSIHLLKYIDDIDYRRNVRAALNRGEAYHQLLQKIMGVGGGDFR